MDAPSDELKLAAVFAVSERYRALGKVIDLADCVKRAGHLADELNAWKGLLTNTKLTAAECRNWGHFEYRYRRGVFRL